MLQLSMELSTEWLSLCVRLAAPCDVFRLESFSRISPRCLSGSSFSWRIICLFGEVWLSWTRIRRNSRKSSPSIHATFTESCTLMHRCFDNQGHPRISVSLFGNRGEATIDEVTHTGFDGVFVRTNLTIHTIPSGLELYGW